MTPKLPPLPAWFESASENLKNDVRNYAIAAIAAQGVPSDEGDLLTIAYLHGFAKGKDSAAAPPAPQAKPAPLHDDIQSVLFEVEQAIRNGACPWQIEAAFEAYEAARRLQQPANGIVKE